MNIKIKILLFFLLVPIFGNHSLFAQNNPPIRASLNLRNVRLSNQNTLKFDLYIIRTSDDWKWLANGTFQFKMFPDSIGINSVTLDSTDLPANTDISGGVIPVNGYKQNFQIFPERLSITCIGPPVFGDCKIIPIDKELLLGSYTVKTTKPIEDKMEWKAVLTYYQALAYKLDKDSVFFNDPLNIRYYKNDNVPLIDVNSEKSSVTFSVDTTNSHKFIIKSFTATYVRDMNIALQFTILEEYKALGYTILRKAQLNPPKSPFQYDPDNIPPDTVFTYKPYSRYFNPIMISQGWDLKNIHIYNGLTDIVQYRGGTYCYQLWATLMTDAGVKDTLIGEDCAGVPALIIAQASSYPNPFELETTAQYEIVEDAYISAEVWDVVGRSLGYLKDPDGNLLDGSIAQTIGWHSAIFFANMVSSQGLFNIVIDAKPKNPQSSIEKGRAIIKVQLIKSDKQGQ